MDTVLTAVVKTKALVTREQSRYGDHIHGFEEEKPT